MNARLLYTTTVGDLMSRDVITVKPTDCLDKVRDLFEKHHIHHLPVVEAGNKLVGLISKEDYSRVLNSFMLFNAERNRELNDRILESVQANDVMTRNVLTLRADSSLNMAIGIFKENYFHSIPVVDEQRNLEGILTTYDLLIFAYQEPSLAEPKA